MPKGIPQVPPGQKRCIDRTRTASSNKGRGGAKLTLPPPPPPLPTAHAIPLFSTLFGPMVRDSLDTWRRQHVLNGCAKPDPAAQPPPQKRVEEICLMHHRAFGSPKTVLYFGRETFGPCSHCCDHPKMILRLRNLTAIHAPSPVERLRRMYFKDKKRGPNIREVLLPSFVLKLYDK